MTIESLDEVASLEVLRSLRAGDVVWVTLKSDVDEDEVEAVQRVLQTVLVEDVSLVVTRKGYVENLRKVSLTELLNLREAIEGALDAYAEYQPADSEV